MAWLKHVLILPGRFLDDTPYHFRRNKMADRPDISLHIRFSRPMSQLSVLTSAVEGVKGGSNTNSNSNSNLVPIVSLEYGLSPSSTLTHRLKGYKSPAPSMSQRAPAHNVNNYNLQRTSRIHNLARQLGKTSRHFAGVKIPVGGKWDVIMIKPCFAFYCLCTQWGGDH